MLSYRSKSKIELLMNIIMQLSQHQFFVISQKLIGISGNSDIYLLREFDNPLRIFKKFNIK